MTDAVTPLSHYVTAPPLLRNRGAFALHQPKASPVGKANGGGGPLCGGRGLEILRLRATHSAQNDMEGALRDRLFI